MLGCLLFRAAGVIKVITTVTGRKAHLIISPSVMGYVTHLANGVELIECGLFKSLDWKRTILVGQQSNLVPSMWTRRRHSRPTAADLPTLPFQLPLHLLNADLFRNCLLL
jgi:hypothetical protein